MKIALFLGKGNPVTYKPYAKDPVDVPCAVCVGCTLRIGGDTYVVRRIEFILTDADGNAVNGTAIKVYAAGEPGFYGNKAGAANGPDGDNPKRRGAPKGGEDA